MMVGYCVSYRVFPDFAPSPHNLAPHKLARSIASVRDDRELNVISRRLRFHLRPWIGRYIVRMGAKAYPKSTLKKIVKAHSNHTLKKDADVSVRSVALPVCLHG